MSGARFRELVVDYLERMRAGSDLSDEDYVTMVRLFNTIGSDRLAERDPLFADYAAAFFPGQVQAASDRLGAVPTKGMALYSYSQDLYIGGPSHGPSRYEIEGSL